MGRIKSVDVARVCAIVAVIAIHTVPFENAGSPVGSTLDLATVINQVARFAVPLFFILSGYFWAQKITDARHIDGVSLTMAKRLLLLFGTWSLIYLLPFNLIDFLADGILGPVKQIYWNVASVARAPFSAMLQGTKRHLWFLTALLCSLCLSAVLLRYKRERTLMGAALLLYIIGLAGKAYSDSPFGFHTGFNLRNGPFFSSIFFVTGYFLQRIKPQANWLGRGLALACAGAILQLVEVRTLHQLWGTSMTQDYVFGTYFFGVGTAMVALSDTRWLDFPRAAMAGSLVLGIYASHMIFVDLLVPFNRVFAGSASWAVCYVAAVFIFSLMLAWLMSRFDVSRKLVG